MNRRIFIAAALSAAFSVSAFAQQDLIGVRPGSPGIKGAFDGFDRTEPWPQHTLKLVYFGTPWNTGKCSIDLLVISEAVRRVDPTGRYITPVLVYPEYGILNKRGNQMVDRYVKGPDAVFTGVSGPADKTLQAALHYGALYFWKTKPIAPEKIFIMPDDHTRLTYLMGPDFDSNLLIFNSDPLLEEMETALREQIRVFFPPPKPKDGPAL